ncbi:MAG: hypothetical protein ACLQNE_20740 [Thermoguttaceae bacterium]
MTTAEEVRQATAREEPSSRGPSSRCGAARESLINDEPWDCYYLESLLPLKEWHE